MIRYLLIATLLLISPAVCAQNYLVNSSFDTDLAGWNLLSTAQPTWTAFDILSNPNSGAAYIRNLEVGPISDSEVLSQCIAKGSGQYIWGAWFYIPSGQASTGSAVIRYSYHASADCSGGAGSSGGHQIFGPFDQWVYLAGNPLNAQLGPSSSVKFIIAIRKTEAEGEFVAWVDNPLLFKELIFKNSFE